MEREATAPATMGSGHARRGEGAVQESSTEVEQTRSRLFRSVPVARSVAQKKIAHLSLAPRANVDDLCH